MIKKITLTAFLVALLTLCHYTLVAQNTWQQITPTGDIPTARQGHSMVVIDSLVYMFGGQDESKFLMITNEDLIAVADNTKVVVKEKSSKGLFGIIHFFLPGTQEWLEEEPENAPPPARSGHKAIEYNGKMYVFFGEGDSGVLGDIWEYDPDTKEWIQINPGSTINPPARFDHSATVYGNMVWIVGGINSSSNPLSDCWAYNFTNNQWEQYANIIGGNINGHAAVFHNGELLIYGGLRNGGILDPNVYKYSPGSDSWQVITSQGSPYPTANAGYAKLESEVFIFGGFSGYYENYCFKWDLTTHQFTQIASGPAVAGASSALCPKAWAKGTKTNYQEFVLFGGSNEGVLNDATWIYTSDIIITGIETMQKDNINIYPNPATNFIILNVDKANNSYLTLNIYNVVGTLVKSETLKQNNRQISIADLSNGIYMVEIKSKEWNGKQKLIIQR